MPKENKEMFKKQLIAVAPNYNQLLAMLEVRSAAGKILENGFLDEVSRNANNGIIGESSYFHLTNEGFVEITCTVVSKHDIRVKTEIVSELEIEHHSELDTLVQFLVMRKLININSGLPTDYLDDIKNDIETLFSEELQALFEYLS